MASKKKSYKAKGGNAGKVGIKDMMEFIKKAHLAILIWAWKEYGDPVFVTSLMHMVHAAMMEFEVKFIDSRQKEAQDGKKRRAGSHKA